MLEHGEVLARFRVYPPLIHSYRRGGGDVPWDALEFPCVPVCVPVLLAS